MDDDSWQSLDIDEVIRTLNSRQSGLSQAEARSRILKYGHNELRRKKKTPAFMIFLRQFLSPLIYVLIIAVIISLAVGHYVDGAVIMGVLILNAVVGSYQEGRAARAMEALVQMAAPHAKVRRDGKVRQIAAREIVPGDIVLLESGDKVPADCRLVEVSNVKLNEATLTGESMPVEKHTGKLGANLSVPERKNIAFMGTVVSYGRATAIVFRTGMSTEIGKIASAIQEVSPRPTPLQNSVSKLSRYLIIIFLGVVAVLVVVGLLRGLDPLEVFLLAVAAAVSAIPEGLPAVVTVVLSLGMRAMARNNAIVRRLVAVETLGAATVICSDKTGTLTLNEMTVRRMYIGGKWVEVSGEGYDPVGQFGRDGQTFDPAQDQLLRTHLRIGALCNDALLTGKNGDFEIYGDPTEGALIVAAAKAGMKKERLEKSLPRLDEIPFQSEKQYMATLHPREGGGRTVFVKGAPERLLGLSQYRLGPEGISPLDEAGRESVSEATTAMAREAMRVIATAYAEFPADSEDLTEDDIRGKLVFVGLSGMADPPREEAKEAIRMCKQAGIRVVMITGDNRVTAESIARQLEIPPGESVTGAEMRQMSDEELSGRIEGISIFARIEPLQKLRIVNALKEHGHVVAMTGDGVNDAPALKAANIGIAMGITGTDVAKEASDMVLADDDFASVVAAIDEGRAIFNRLRNVIFFLLSTNLGELVALILSVLFVGQAPLYAVHIIWNNLVTDTAVAVPLGLEPKFGDELKQPPRHPQVGLIFPGLLMRAIYMSLVMGLGIYIIFNWALNRGSLDEARSVAFSAMVVFEWFRAFNARSDEHTVFRLGIFRNRTLLLAIAGAVALQMAAIYAPPFQVAFRTVPLSLNQWGVVVLAGGSLFAVDEIRKALFPRLFSLGKWQPVSKNGRRFGPART